MSDINACIFSGRVGATPELKHTPDGTPTCAFSMAVERTKPAGAENAAVDWITLVAWDKTAEIAAKYLTKGTFVVVSCILRTRKWQDKAGQNRKETEFRVLNFRMAGTRSSGETPPTDGTTAPSSADDFAELPEDTGDLPF